MKNTYPNPVSKPLRDYLGRRFPYDAQKKYTPTRYNELEYSYQIWRPRLALMTVVSIVLLAAVYCFILYYTSVLLRPLLYKPGELIYAPGAATFGVPALPMAFGTAPYFMEVLQRALLGNVQYEEFEDYFNFKEGYDNRAASIWLRNLMLLPTLILMHFAFSFYITFSANEVTVKKFFEPMRHTYKLSDVQHVIYYRAYRYRKNNNIAYTPHYEVIFADGRKLFTSWYFDDAISAAPFIKKLGKQVDTVAEDKS